MDFTDSGDPAFEKAFAFTWGFEVDSDDPNKITNDDGGITKYGISQDAFPHIDISALTPNEAKNIYKKEYWDPYLLHEIYNLDVSTKLFDMNFNMGSRASFRNCQRALNRIYDYDVVEEDGVLGPITLQWINKDHCGLIKSIKDQAASYYQNLVKEKPILSEYIHGWLKRAYA